MAAKPGERPKENLSAARIEKEPEETGRATEQYACIPRLYGDCCQRAGDRRKLGGLPVVGQGRDQKRRQLQRKLRGVDARLKRDLCDNGGRRSDRRGEIARDAVEPQ